MIEVAIFKKMKNIQINPKTIHYAKIKMDLPKAPVKAVEMFKCDCGHTIPRCSVMSTSTGTSCPDCYDRMSM